MPCAREGKGSKDVRNAGPDESDTADHVARMSCFVACARKISECVSFHSYYMDLEYLFTSWEVCNVVALGEGGRLTSHEPIDIQQFFEVVYSVCVNVLLISRNAGAGARKGARRL